MSVTVLEAADEIGGGTRTGELTVPGVLHDVCSAVPPVRRRVAVPHLAAPRPPRARVALARGRPRPSARRRPGRRPGPLARTRSTRLGDDGQRVAADRSRRWRRTSTSSPPRSSGPLAARAPASARAGRASGCGPPAGHGAGPAVPHRRGPGAVRGRGRARLPPAQPPDDLRGRPHADRRRARRGLAGRRGRLAAPSPPRSPSLLRRSWAARSRPACR